MPDKKLADAAARKKIVNNLNTNILVEAGAGSGKTTSLVKRLVALIKSGTCKVQNVAVITFTRKAAAELKERFHLKLKEEYNKTNDNDIKKALNNLDKCFTGTIHSFCSRLLRERPVEAGVDPEFEELDELEQKVLLQESWEEYLHELRLNQPDLINKFDKLGISPLELKDSFISITQYPEIEIASMRVKKPDLQPVLKKVLSFAREAQKYIPEKEPVKGFDKLQGKINSVIRLQNCLDLNKDKDIIKLIKSFESGTGVTLNRWADRDKAREYRDEKVNYLYDNHIKPALRQWREYCHYHIAGFLQPAVSYYREVKASESKVDFQDLLLITAKMLRENPEVRKYFQKKYRYLLVDEFQDTDPIQAEVIFYLTGSNIEEQVWSKVNPIPGSLFVVGDPKQSIFRFRRADTNIYNQVKKLIKKSGGEILKLSSNFRSRNAVSDYLNPVFADIFPEEDNNYQAQYVPLNTVHEDNHDCGVKMISIPQKFRKKDAIVTQDAEYIAKIIRSSLDGNMKLARSKEEIKQGLTANPVYNDFMIILRYKDCMDYYARALESYGIPSVMTGGSTFDKSEEIKELYKLCKLLNDINNQVLLVSVLRGLFFGISDDELYQFKYNGGYFNIYSDIPEDVEAKLQKTFNSAFTEIRKYYKWIYQYNPSLVLEKIIIDLGLFPYTTTLEMDESRCGNLFYLLEKMRQIEIEGKLSFHEMVEHFGVIMDSTPEKELNINLDEKGVRIMNLHKAKGLQAPVVFLAHPCKKVDTSPDRYIERVKEKPVGDFLFTKKEGWHDKILGQPVHWDIKQEEEKRYQDAEENRLLYVAATRAKNMLIISSSERTNNKNSWDKLITNKLSDQIIKIPDVKKVAEVNEGIELNNELFNQKTKEIYTWKEDLLSPSYRKLAPTDFKKEAELFNIERQEGGSKAWGTVIHLMLEKLVNEGKASDLFIERNLEEYNIDLDRKEEVREILNNFKNSDLWERIDNAQQVYTEMPFSLKVNPDDKLSRLIKNESNKPVILTGVIDLIFKEDGQWVIFDYKTDRVKEKEDLDKLKEIYYSQVELYSNVWEEITGEEVMDKELLFIGY